MEVSLSRDAGAIVGHDDFFLGGIGSSLIFSRLLWVGMGLLWFGVDSC